MEFLHKSGNKLGQLMKKSYFSHKCYSPTMENMIYDTWIPWTKLSINTAFKTSTKCVGNGENKLAKELGIQTPPGGQNSTVDLKHDILGFISVKNMTSSDCILGTEGCQNIRRVFRKIVFPLVSWCEKYKDVCESVNNIWSKLQMKNGTSRTTVLEGIERFELSSSNLKSLNQILEDLKNLPSTDISTKSEYFEDICKNISDSSLIEKFNKCVRKEAISYTLIIVHKKNGWIIVKDLERITCPRITRGAPRISYKL